MENFVSYKGKPAKIIKSLKPGFSATEIAYVIELLQTNEPVVAFRSELSEIKNTKMLGILYGEK